MVYVQGRYTENCCPEYLKPDNFAALKGSAGRGGLAERISLHTATVSQFLAGNRHQFSKYVLLDHMDWMSSYQPAALAEEWSLVLARAGSGARIIFRSALVAPTYLESLELGPDRSRLRDRLRFHPELTAALQPLDRVHTYAGFHVADLWA